MLQIQEISGKSGGQLTRRHLRVPGGARGRARRARAHQRGLAAHGESAARRGRAPRAAACASARAGELDGGVACQSVS